MRQLLQKILKSLSAKVLVKYRPEIIGITGSVGKSSAKEAIYAVLSAKYKVRRNVGNYNNEIGVPLTILGHKTAGKSVFGWLGIFLSALNLLLVKDKNYPEILILEMAADKPGDINYLLNFVPIRVGVVTAVAPVHTEQFNDIEGVFNEKKNLLSSLTKNGFAALNFDDEYVAKMKTRARVVSYGFKRGADIMCADFGFDFEKKEKEMAVSGIFFKLSSDRAEIPAHIKGVIGKQSIYAALAAAAVGTIYGFNLIEIAENLKKVVYLPGRMRILKGIKRTTLIDDSYNASPRSMVAAIETLAQMPINENNRRIAVLGDMLELGSYTEEGHVEAGKALAKNNIDMFVAVGEKMEEAINAALHVGMKAENIFKFGNAEDAGLFAQEKMEKGDVVLIKGSRRMQMEKVTEELMAEPELADTLLVR